MAQQEKLSVHQRNRRFPFWAQIIVAFWMIGVLVWFFSDPKIQHWLAAMLSDLMQWLDGW